MTVEEVLRSLDDSGDSDSEDSDFSDGIGAYRNDFDVYDDLSESMEAGINGSDVDDTHPMTSHDTDSCIDSLDEGDVRVIVNPLNHQVEPQKELG